MKEIERRIKRELGLHLQLVKLPLIYVLRGYAIGDEDKHGTTCF